MDFHAYIEKGILTNLFTYFVSSIQAYIPLPPVNLQQKTYITKSEIWNQ